LEPFFKGASKVKIFEKKPEPMNPLSQKVRKDPLSFFILFYSFSLHLFFQKLNFLGNRKGIFSKEEAKSNEEPSFLRTLSILSL